MQETVIDLSGSQGNAFYIMAQVRKLNLKHELDLDVDSILEEMQSGTYQNLLDIFEEHFGQYVTLINR